MFLKEFKIDFQNRKWYYPNRKWNYFSFFQASDQNIAFITCFLCLSMISKLIFKIENGFIPEIFYLKPQNLQKLQPMQSCYLTE